MRRSSVFTVPGWSSEQIVFPLRERKPTQRSQALKASVQCLLCPQDRSGQRWPALCPPQQPAGFFVGFINSLCTCNYTRTPIWCVCSFRVCSSKLYPSVPEAGSHVSGDPWLEIYGGVSWGQCRGREGRAARGTEGEAGLRISGKPQQTPRGGLKSSLLSPNPMHQQVLLALTSKTTFNFKRSFLKLIFNGV